MLGKNANRRARGGSSIRGTARAQPLEQHRLFQRAFAEGDRAAAIANHRPAGYFHQPYRQGRRVHRGGAGKPSSPHYSPSSNSNTQTLTTALPSKYRSRNPSPRPPSHAQPRAHDDEVVAEEFTLPYDHLVLAHGASPLTFNTPGVTANAYFMREAHHARQARVRLRQRMPAHQCVP